jgi:uracil-DNA glycosylase
MAALKFIDEEPYYGSAAPLVPETDDLGLVAAKAMGCTACHLWRNATQTVFGEGAKTSRVMLVGEQPGDKEDVEGHPFVGPAGKLLGGALEEAGIDRREVYVTNAVKHFKWVPSGARRLHKKPNRGEIKACRPWLEAELEIVRPEVLVLLGATAAQALLGPEFRLTQNRGRFVDSDFAPHLIATLHPSAILRAPDPESRRIARASFVEDLRLVAMQVASSR